MKFWIVMLFACVVGAGVVSAQELLVCADKAFEPALREIVPLFTQQTGVEVVLTSGRSMTLASGIVRNKISPDVFFAAEADAMSLIIQRGKVDVALKRNVLWMPAAAPVEDAPAPEPIVAVAAVLLQAEQRLQAMAFLACLVSEDARAIFIRRGFSVP